MTNDELNVFLDQLDDFAYAHPSDDPTQARARQARAKALTTAQRNVLGQIMDSRDPLLILTGARQDLDVPEITDELADWLAETDAIWRPSKRKEAAS